MFRKPQRKKRKNDFEDDELDEDNDSDTGSADSDDGVASKPGSNAVSEDEALDGSDVQEDRLGRGARGRAKVLIPDSILLMPMLMQDQKRARKEAKKQKREKNGN